MIYAFNNIVVEGHAEPSPAVVGHHVSVIAGPLDGTYATIYISEIFEHSAQLRAQPQRAGLAVHILENKDASGLFGIEPGRLDYPHDGIGASVAIHIARLILIYGVGQSPAVKVVQAVVLLLQIEALR